MPMHFLGGFWLGLATVWFFKIQSISGNSIAKIIFSVFLLGVGWEIFEIIFNNHFAQNPFNAVDTLSDICFDVSGGLCVILYIWKRM